MKNMFIVGGSTGIGYQTVKKFLEKGYTVTNLSRTSCNQIGVQNILCDVTESQNFDKELDNFVANNETLDILIYSAGFSMACPLQHVDTNDYRYLFEVNLFAFMTILQKFLPLLRKNGGKVCVVSSLGAIMPIAHDSFYSASKSAVNMLATTLSLELKQKGVDIISVMPGGTKTNFSYKRESYSLQEVGDYATEQNIAVERLFKMEQNGANARCVASTIYRVCTKQNPPIIVASGIINKIVFLLSRILPQRFIVYLNSKIYFG